MLGGYSFLRWLDAKRKSMAPQLVESVARDKRTEELCARLGERIGAIRVYVSEFHNGQHYNSGHSIDKKTRTIEWDADGVQNMQKYYENVLCSTITDEMELILSDGPSFTLVSNLKQGAFKSMCQRDNAKSIMRIGIYNKDGKLDAMLGADFETVTPPSNLSESMAIAGLISLHFNESRAN